MVRKGDLRTKRGGRIGSTGAVKKQLSGFPVKALVLADVKYTAGHSGKWGGGTVTKVHQVKGTVHK